jgi:hypothetical protein
MKAIADPGVGREDAPIGSEDWAKRVRLQMQTLVNHATGEPESLQRYREIVHKHEAWRLLTDEKGRHFDSWEAFCEYRQPWGLGKRRDAVRTLLDAVATYQLKTKNVSLRDLRLDGETQARASLDAETVDDYADKIRAGVALPPPVAFFDGSRYWLADGFHRAEATRKTGASSMDVEVRKGTREDAIWFACGANQGHGLRRTNADKRRAVEMALRLKPESSDRAIAEHVGVAPNTVKAVREESGAQVAQVNQPAARTGRDGKTYPAAPKKKAAPPPAPAAAAPPVEEPSEETPPAPEADDAPAEQEAPSPPAPPPESPEVTRMRQRTEYALAVRAVGERFAGLTRADKRELLLNEAALLAT